MIVTQPMIRTGNRPLNAGIIIPMTQIPVNLTASGDTVLVAAEDRYIIQVYKLLLVGGGASDVRLWSGPSSENNSITGLMPFPAGFALALDMDDFTISTAVGKALVWSSTQAIQLGGMLVYSREFV